MHVRITSKKFKRSIIQMASLLLLILYLAGTSQLELIHSFVHDHESLISHSDKQEKDPCHRLLYHTDTEQGCDHGSHLIVSDNCKMCDLAFQGDQIILTNLNFSQTQFESGQFDFYKSYLDSYWAVISSSRAPPVRA